MTLFLVLISGSSLSWKWHLIWVNWPLWGGNIAHLFQHCMFHSLWFLTDYYLPFCLTFFLFTVVVGWEILYSWVLNQSLGIIYLNLFILFWKMIIKFSWGLFLVHCYSLLPCDLVVIDFHRRNKLLAVGKRLCTFDPPYTVQW